MEMTDEELEKIFKASQFLEDKQLQVAVAYGKEKKLSLYEAIISKDYLTDEQLGQIIADNYQLRFVRLTKESIPQEILNIIPESVAEQQKIIAFGTDKTGLKLASNKPLDPDIIKMVAKKSGKEVIAYYATGRDIDESLNLYKKQIQSRFDDILKTSDGKTGALLEKDTPVNDILDTIIQYAYESKTSDIHIEPRKDISLVRLRIDGILHDVLKLPKSLHEQLISKIKVESKLHTDEHQAAQDGKMQKKTEKEDIDIRISIVPIVNGEGCVMRLLTSHNRNFGLHDLGMSDKDLKTVNAAISKPYGMILSTGPTGSGKTTSIYSVLKILNTSERNIATIEDPVEYEVEGINQIQVNPQTNLTFASGLRSILRQDPDIIYVGEIRDAETADIAVSSAMTGHLVVSTLHTNDASTSIPRLIDMEIEPFLVASTVNVIIAQRLVRKICDKCKVSYMGTIAELSNYFSKEIITKLLNGKQDTRLYKGKGCAVCHNTGYVGRIGIFEVLSMSPDIQKLINKKADSTELTTQAIKEGMTTMVVDGLGKVLQGITSIEEILRVTRE